jgi:hypothetical protein
MVRAPQPKACLETKRNSVPFRKKAQDVPLEEHSVTNSPSIKHVVPLQILTISLHQLCQVGAKEEICLNFHISCTF